MKQSAWTVPLVMCAIVIAGCTNEASRITSVNQHEARKRQYELLQAEFLLAEAETPYIVVDMTASILNIKLGGAVVWDEEVVWNETDGQTVDLPMLGVKPYDYVVECLLLEHNKRYPDTLLQVIADALKIKPDLLQREMPIHFCIRTAQDLTLDFEASEDSLQQHNGKSLKSIFDGLFNWDTKRQRLHTKLPVERALTLYYAAKPGTPVLYK